MALGRRAAKGTTFGNGATEARSYTGFRGEVASILHQTSGQSTIVQLDYGYNKMHSRTWERFGGSGSSGDGFAYDKLERLTTAWMGSVQPSSPSGQQYAKKIDCNYDDDGNRSSVVTTLWNQSPASTSYSTNNLNEYTSVGGTSQSHDVNGNLTDNGTLQFKYDYKNLIVQVIRKSDSTVLGSYRYDALGRRVEKNTAAGVERHIRSIVGEPGRTVENFSHVVSTYDGSNNWQQNFVWSDEIDGIVMLEQADVLDHDSDGNTTEVTRSYFHRNALGSVMEITDALEAVTVSYRYDPYGSLTITRGGTLQTADPLGQHWTFTGRFYDEESDLCYYRARYYDPETGRFLERDPLGHIEGPNLREYASSNPRTRRDASGLYDPDDPKYNSPHSSADKSYTVTIYVDEDDVIDGGHTFVDVSADGEPIDSGGLYPEEGEGPFQAGTGTVVDNDRGDPWDICLTFPVSEAGARRAVAKLRGARQKGDGGMRYHGLFFNCTTFALWIAGESDADLPPYGPIVSPNMVAGWAESEDAKSYNVTVTRKP